MIKHRHDCPCAGQALPLAMVLLVAVAATVFFLFNSGQLVQEKIRLTNTADAVAYSAGVFQARMLNYDAYTNRAMIANEIALGQAVGLASWAKYAAVTAENIAPYIRLIPYVGHEIAQALEEFANAVNAEGGYTTLLAGAMQPLDQAIKNLSDSQRAMHGHNDRSAIDNRWKLIEEIARRNDPDVRVDPTLLADNLVGFSSRQTSAEQRKPMGQIVHDGRDAFLKSRNWEIIVGFTCNPERIIKRGSTELIDYTEGWKSMDTLSIHKFKLTRRVCEHKETPIGWGSAMSIEGLNDWAYSYAGSRSNNPSASYRAEQAVASGFPPDLFYNGAIPPYYDLADALEDEPEKYPKLRLTLRVTKDSGRQHYSGGGSAITPGGRLERYAGAHAADVSAATGSVEVYFERPDGLNPLYAKEEFGSLFNPYWQARLSGPSASLRRVAQAKQGRTTP